MPDVDIVGGIAQVFQGGLPQLALGKPVSDALGRLIAGTADIPAAWLEGFAKRIRSESDARAAVKNALATAAAERAGDDTALVERALSKWADSMLGRQQNREKVVYKAVELLGEDPPKDGGHAPSDEFMASFEPKSEQAASDNLQDLFARILAGEIRKPGSTSLATLQFVSVMDQPLAQIITRMKARVFDGDKIIQVGSVASGPLLLELKELAGFNLVQTELSYTLSGPTAFVHGPSVLVVEGSSLPAAVLTRMGREVMALLTEIPTRSDTENLGREIRAEGGITRVQLGDLISSESGQVTHRNSVEL